MTETWDGNRALRRYLVPVEELRPHPRNPRRGNLLEIGRSLDRFGQQRPILALPDGTIVAGNHTYLAAAELGWSHVAVIRSDLTDADIEAYLAADNRTADLGGYDDRVLLDLLTDLQQQDQALVGTGYDDEFLRQLLASVRADDRRLASYGDPDAAPPLPAEPQSTPGVYELGPHRLVCGDACDAEAYEMALNEGLADTVWTDPPYGVDYEGRTSERLRIANDNNSDLGRILRRALNTTLAHTKPGGNWYVASASGAAGDLFLDVLRELGVRRHTLVWVKNAMVLSRMDYHYRHELIYYGWKPGSGRVRPSDRTLTSVLEFDRPQRSTEHPTMKPVALVKHCVENSTQPDGLVLDPFAGSGSTLIACEAAGLRCAAIEIDPRYCDVIRQRYADYVGDERCAP